MKNIGQNRRMSLIESGVSVSIGYVLTVVVQYFVNPMVGIAVLVKQAFLISVVLVVVAFVKNYSVRRLFNCLHISIFSASK